MKKYKNMTNLFFELGYAFNVRNVGWDLIKVANKPSIAEHSYRNAVIALILAVNENAKNPYRVALAALLHKMHKIRLGDRHKVSAAYANYGSGVKERIRKDQVSMLDKDTSNCIMEIFYIDDDEKVLVKDADQLELALEAKEYLDKGYKAAKVWIERIEEVLISNTAKKVFKEIITTEYFDWWKNLKIKPQMEREEYISRV